MAAKPMTSLERTMTTLAHQEPDRVPLFLMLSTYGAKEQQVPVRDYFSRPGLVADTQLRMREKYGHDCLCATFYTALEFEAQGGEVIFRDDAAPVAGEPLIKTRADIERLTMPRIEDCPGLTRLLDVTQRLKQAAGQQAPIIGSVTSPFSLPVMQMGFAAYIELLYFDPVGFQLLMNKNSTFCSQWANAQLRAGATAIGYADPLASPEIIDKETYLQTGYPVDIKTMKAIDGPTVMHLASAIALPVIGDIIGTPALAVGFSANDDAAAIKKQAAGHICLLGNLNGLEMVHWSAEETIRAVRSVIEQAGPGGGFILSDNHGDIPWPVPEETLLTVSSAVREYGRYQTGGEI